MGLASGSGMAQSSGGKCGAGYGVAFASGRTVWFFGRSAPMPVTACARQAHRLFRRGKPLPALARLHHRTGSGRTGRASVGPDAEADEAGGKRHGERGSSEICTPNIDVLPGGSGTGCPHVVPE